jgi:hypothetical protein
MNSGIATLRMLEPFEQQVHAVEAELLGPGAQRGDPSRRRASVSR